MSSEMYSKMRQNPKFQALVKKRTRFATALSVVVLTAFYGYIMVVAFSPATLAQPMAEGSTLTVGILSELSMFVGFWVLVALYVRRANTEYDALTAEIVKDAKADLGVTAREVA
jgi:cation/acetate symporter